ncbi:Uma2 family endonuclease [Armatimonas rosea]|uniref:Uma2 family endonuclease n=1 Tax=Armatimonas rosea TaxID=685828 RepID=A0A7W9SPH8_ARMRO|nr:Uma2 family endonuclease [Armatimonas rosea]MBB6050080.1 Uma2 family endonuclease [Armatimonas rosea]
MALPALQELEATLDDLCRYSGKAELLYGQVVPLMPTGRAPSFAALEIAVSLRLHVRGTGLPGVTVADNAGFVVDLPHRRSFSPDAAYYEGPNSGMKFYEGAPRFAAEVRSENDYGVIAEHELEQKRHDYFAAGCLVVWDVDLLGEEVIVRKYTPASGATTPEATFTRGENADAEPAVPGWTMPVDDLFEP